VTTLSSIQVPFLGNSQFALSVAQAATNSQAYLFLATTPAAAPIPLGAGCFLYLDAASLLASVNAGVSPTGPLQTGTSGAANFALPIPQDPLLSGTSITFQAAVMDPMALLGITVSNGVTCVLY
jgi:hypothetical protein